MAHLSMEGLSDKQISEQLSLSLPTIRTYWKRIRMKVGSTTRSETIAMMLRHQSEAEKSRFEETISSLRGRLDQHRSFIRATLGDDAHFAICSASGDELICASAPFIKMHGLAVDNMRSVPYGSLVVSKNESQMASNGVFTTVHEVHRDASGNQVPCVVDTLNIADEQGDPLVRLYLIRQTWSS